MKIIYFCIYLYPLVLVYPRRISIGLVCECDIPSQKAFQSKIETMSHNHSDAMGMILHSYFTRISSDLFDVSHEACNLFECGIAVIIGSLGRINLGYFQSVCDALEVPFLSVRWDPLQERGKFTNLFPSSNTLRQFHQSLIGGMKWKSYSIVYDSTDSLIKFCSSLDEMNIVNHPITFYRIDNTRNYREVLRRIKDTGEKNVVIDCNYVDLEDVLHSALQVGIISDNFNLFIASFDLQVLNLDPFYMSGVNLTGIRITNPSPHRSDGSSYSEIEDHSNIRTEQALLYDAVNLFIEGFQRLEFATIGDIQKLLCNDSTSWEHGISLNNFIKSVEMEGSSGRLVFDNAGLRSDFDVEILKLTRVGLEKTGLWSPRKNIEWLPNRSNHHHHDISTLQNVTFRVLIALTKPYGMLRETVLKMTGNDQYEGFAVDIINEISKMLGFNYTFSVQDDNVYGSLNQETGQWNGMLRKIIDNEADLAITDLTITAERETAVDFTMPFMNLGISILYQKPKAAPPSLMSFLLPFSADVWLYLMLAYVIVSVLFFILGRMCPEEWNNIYPCIEEPEELENQFTIKNSLWFCMGAIMQQGSEIAPIGNSTRMLAGCWWFFCLIMVSSYTANLAAFLTVETVERPIKNAEDLANQDIIRYGAKKGGSTLGFFKDSNSSTYSKMYQYMIENSKDVLTAGNDEGKKKVLNENYAFLMESSSIEYIQERECNLTQIGGLLDQKGYGIAMKKNASFRNELSGAVLKLQEMGILTALKNKWWKEKGGGGRCQEETGGSQAEELGLANVGGVFLVLVVGVGISFLGTIIELFHNLIFHRRNTEDDLNIRIINEINFIIKLGTSTKPMMN